jgi:hypothetical protein
MFRMTKWKGERTKRFFTKLRNVQNDKVEGETAKRFFGNLPVGRQGCAILNDKVGAMTGCRVGTVSIIILVDLGCDTDECSMNRAGVGDIVTLGGVP